MTNLEEFNNLSDELMENVTLLKENAGLLDSTTANLTSLNLVLSSYLPSIAKSLAIIADKMNGEEVNASDM